jgi:NADPH-dependent ferric siderophore reductase
MNEQSPIVPDNTKHQTRRLRHEIHRRLLTVKTIEKLTPRMLRFGSSSPDLSNFVSASHDDHIKLFFPVDAGDGMPVMRDFTPRLFDIDRGTLVIDFALHDAGPATTWAASAKIGDTLEIGGPRGSIVVPDDYDWYLLIGDETALPAIGRRVEELRPGVPVATFATIADAAELQTFTTRADWQPQWLERTGAPDAELLRAALDNFQFPAGDGFIWVAAEASVARAIRHYLIEERGHPKEWIKAAGYWKRGAADTHETIEG